MATPRATWFEGTTGTMRIALSGSWNADHAAVLETLIESIVVRKAGTKRVERYALACEDIVGLDTLGAYLVHKVRTLLADGGHHVEIEGLRVEQAALLNEAAYTPVRLPALPETGGAYHLLADVGEAVVDAGKDLANGVAFFGAIIAALGRLLIGRAKLRLPSVITQLERVGLRGVPIIMLISFLVGAIIAQQSIFQLRTFGTVHFVADLLGILVLRELAVLLTAIMIAGRSGSSFTAELGSMKMREEIDALETMGLDPLEVLVLPRIVALIIALPLLTFLASMAGIAGGAIVAFVYGGVSSEVFFSRLQGAIGFNTFMVGMIKAPFMALVIGLIACIEGFAVRGSAESLGAHTTASVVKAIFVVIVVDGLFAMFFAAIDY
ncbi:MAG: putative ABC transport system permease [Beijerinckiaceae bacterium]|nr:MAG: putative ABC transport system permease [Beijerinckiaceae bacterium]